MLHRYLIAEVLKLRHSLALLLCVAAPFCVAALGTVIAFDRKASVPLDRFALSASGIWSFMMLPLAVTALSVLMAQMEHGSKSWNHILTLPRARPDVYLAKALVMLGLVALMSALLFVFTLAGAALLALLHPVGVMGEADLGRFAGVLARMVIASALVCMLQLWVALRYRSFVVPLIFGIAGTFVAVATLGAGKAAWFPWLLATDVLATNPAQQQLGLVLGGVGGAAALALMLVHLSRREA